MYNPREGKGGQNYDQYQVDKRTGRFQVETATEQGRSNRTKNLQLYSGAEAGQAAVYDSENMLRPYYPIYPERQYNTTWQPTSPTSIDSPSAASDSIFSQIASSVTSTDGLSTAGGDWNEEGYEESLVDSLGYGCGNNDLWNPGDIPMSYTNLDTYGQIPVDRNWYSPLATTFETTESSAGNQNTVATNIQRQNTSPLTMDDIIKDWDWGSGGVVGGRSVDEQNSGTVYDDSRKGDKEEPKYSETIKAGKGSEDQLSKTDAPSNAPVKRSVAHRPRYSKDLKNAAKDITLLPRKTPKDEEIWRNRVNECIMEFKDEGIDREKLRGVMKKIRAKEYSNSN